MSVALATSDIARARLPVAYEQAKTALAECERLDECKAWSDKMAALASYARQAEDETLLKTAMRIQGRAVRRAGELLKEFDARPQNASKQNGSTPTLIGRREAGEQAGMSRDQQVTAVRVANVPAEQFEMAVESADPPTVTALAEMGRQPRPAKIIDHTDGCDPAEFALATQVLAMLRRNAEILRGTEPAAVVRGASGDELREAKANIRELRDWFDKLEMECSDGV